MSVIEGPIKIFDLKDPTSPQELSSISMQMSNHRALALSSDGNHLFAGSYGFLEIIDVSDLRSPSLIATHDLKMDSESGYYDSKVSMVVVPNGNTVYLACLGTHIIDATKEINQFSERYFIQVY